MTSKIGNILGLSRLFNQNSPWGNPRGNNNNPWGSGGGNNGGGNNRGPNSPKPGGDPEKNQGEKLNPNPFECLSKKIQDFFNNLNNGGNQNGKNSDGKSLFGLFLTVLFVIWMASGIYKINSDENGLVLYFGKFYSIATPGLNYHLPAPFGKVIKASVTRVNTEEFGVEGTTKSFLGRKTKAPSGNHDNLMLTGDENIVDIDFQIQWQVADIKNFVFNLEDPETAIRKAGESAIREIIARTPIADALSDGKRKIEQDTKVLLQQILDSYGAGVRIVLV